MFSRRIPKLEFIDHDALRRGKGMMINGSFAYLGGCATNGSVARDKRAARRRRNIRARAAKH